MNGYETNGENQNSGENSSNGAYQSNGYSGQGYNEQNNGQGYGQDYNQGYNNAGYNNGYGQGYQNTPPRRLAKSASNRMICGVCAGIAEYFNWDPTLVRIAWVALSLVLGVGFLGALAYFIIAVIMPEA